MNNIERIRRELERRGLDAVLVTDEKNQRYAAGFPFTDGAVLVAAERAYLITDSRYIEAAEAAVDGCVTVWLFDRERPLRERVREALAESGAQRLAAEDQRLSHAGFLMWEKTLGLTLLPAGDLFQTLRAVKSEEELASMTEAQRISEAALEEVLHILRPGMTEVLPAQYRTTAVVATVTCLMGASLFLLYNEKMILSRIEELKKQS